MAKKTLVKKFQTLIRHKPDIELVRTDIKIHCNIEDTLSTLMKSFAIDDTTFDDIFAEQTATKRSLFKRKVVTGKEAVRAVVATYLKCLIEQARIKEFHKTLDERIVEQEEIKQALKVNPECFHAVVDVDKQVTPEQAIDKLHKLKKDSQKIHDDMKKISDDIAEKVSVLITDKDEIMKELAESLEQQWRKVNGDELDRLLKILCQFSG
jgi:hypothetical protein